MRPKAAFAIGALIAFTALGTVLMYGVGGGLPPASMMSSLSPVMLAGAICLLLAAYSGMALLGVNNGGSRRRLNVGLTSLGIVLIVLAPFIPFPVGCNMQTWFNPTNASSGCPMNPIGSWSTVWPNVLLLDIGLVIASMGFAPAKADRLTAMGAGVGLIMGGLVLVAFGSSFTYMTSCPANGCPPLTSAGWWSLFWPNVLAQVIGAVQIVAGGTACFTALRRERAALSLAATTPI